MKEACIACEPSHLEISSEEPHELLEDGVDGGPSYTFQDGVVPSNVKAAIFMSHFLARWAWRTWEFAVALLLIKLRPASLLLVSIYGLLDNLSRLMFGSLTGQYVDRMPRLQGAASMYLLQNLCILVSAAAAGCLVLLMGNKGPDTINRMVYWFLMAICLIAGSLCSVGSMGAAAAVEREWTKTLCGSNDPALSKLNAGMRAIDLACQMLAPTAAGVTMTYAGMLPATCMIAGYSLLAWLPECILLRVAHGSSHLLRAPKPQGPPAHHTHPRRFPLQSLCSGWSTYLTQPTLPAAVALALLYLTVLSLGFLMTSYLTWQGMNEATLSYFRAAGALSGLSATLLFPPLQSRVGLKATGGLGVSWQLGCLIMGVVPVVLHHLGWAGSGGSGSSSSSSSRGAQVVLLVMLSGLVLSRMGLWLFDLAVTQMQQDMVEPHEIGAVMGVQGSLQSLFEILSFVAGCLVRSQQHFYWLMIGSLGSVAAAAALYARFMISPATGGQQRQCGMGQDHSRASDEVAEEGMERRHLLAQHAGDASPAGHDHQR